MFGESTAARRDVDAEHAVAMIHVASKKPQNVALCLDALGTPLGIGPAVRGSQSPTITASVSIRVRCRVRCRASIPVPRRASRARLVRPARLHLPCPSLPPTRRSYLVKTDF